MKLVYPIKIAASDDTGYHFVYIPDFDGYTQGSDMFECLEMAKDYITNCIVSGMNIPKPTPLDEVNTLDDEYIYTTLVPIDTVKILDSRSKMVRKNITIPEWLNDEAERQGVNFSQTLRDALLSQLAL